MTPPTHFDDLHLSIKRNSLRLPLSLRARKGVAIRIPGPSGAGKRTDCHGLRPRNDGSDFRLALLLLLWKISGLVGGVMTPPYSLKFIDLQNELLRVAAKTVDSPQPKLSTIHCQLSTHLSRALRLRGWRRPPSAGSASPRRSRCGRQRSAYRRTPGPSSFWGAGW